MHDCNPGDIARPSALRHAVAPGEDEEASRIFQRNASRAQRPPEDRCGYWLRPAVSDPSSARHGAVGDRRKVHRRPVRQPCEAIMLISAES